jgi:hypothetical protein
MVESPISSNQLKRLQTLYSKAVSRQPSVFSADRAARLAWANSLLEARGAKLETFRQLSKKEAERLIAALQKILPREDVTRRRPDRATAQRYATEGRRSSLAAQRSPLSGPPDAATLELLQTLKLRCFELGVLSGEQAFQAWLRSRNSPTRGSTWLGSQASCNRVIWALKGLLRRAERAEAKKCQSGKVEEEAIPA